MTTGEWVTTASPEAVLLRATLIFSLTLALCGYLYVYFLGRSRRSPLAGPPVLPREALRPVSDALLDDLADALLGIDGEDRILLANRRAGELFGCLPEAIRGRPYQTFLILPEAFSERSARQLVSAGRLVGLEHPAWGLRDDGSRFAVRVTVTASRSGPLRALLAVREADPEPDRSGPPGLDAGELLPGAARIQQFAALLAGSTPPASPDREYAAVLSMAADDLHARLQWAHCQARLALRRQQREDQPVLLEKWLDQRGKAFQEENPDTGDRLALALPQSTGLVAMVDAGLLREVIEAVLNFALKAYRSKGLVLHMAHEGLAMEPSLPVPWTPPESRLAGGHERRITFQFIAEPPQEATHSLMPEAGRLLEWVKAHPYCQQAVHLGELLGGELAIETNESAGVVFQFAFTCLCLGVEPPAVRPEAPPSPRQETRGAILLVTRDATVTAQLQACAKANSLNLWKGSPEGAVEALRSGAQFQLLAYQPDFSEEPDFDLTYEVRQLRSESELPILLLQGSGRNPPPSVFHDVQDILEWPIDSDQMSETIRSRCSSA